MKVGDFAWAPTLAQAETGTKYTAPNTFFQAGVVASIEPTPISVVRGRKLYVGWTRVTFTNGELFDFKQDKPRIEKDKPSLALFWRRQGWSWASKLQAWGDKTAERALKSSVMYDQFGKPGGYPSRELPDRVKLRASARRNASAGWAMQRRGEPRP